MQKKKGKERCGKSDVDVGDGGAVVDVGDDDDAVDGAVAVVAGCDFHGG